MKNRLIRQAMSLCCALAALLLAGGWATLSFASIDAAMAMTAQQDEGKIKQATMQAKPLSETALRKMSAGTSDKLSLPAGKGGSLQPKLALKGAVTEKIGGKEFTVTLLTILNWEKFSTELFNSAPDLPPCGKNKNSARTWLTIHRQDNGEQIYGYCAFKSPSDLKDFSYATPKGTTPPLEVFVRLTDRATSTVYQSNCINAWSGIQCGKS